MAGYSKTPLSTKLGFKPGFRVRIAGAPANYRGLVAPVPEGVCLSTTIRTRVDLWHLFVARRADLEHRLPKAMKQIRQNGMIWVSWPKKSSRVATDVTEDVIRAVALPMGLVDIKVCAVDEVWSGLKLVIRVSNRK